MRPGSFVSSGVQRGNPGILHQAGELRSAFPRVAPMLARVSVR
jgi:hypothetical protein